MIAKLTKEESMAAIRVGRWLSLFQDIGSWCQGRLLPFVFVTAEAVDICEDRMVQWRVAIYRTVVEMREDMTEGEKANMREVLAIPTVM